MKCGKNLSRLVLTMCLLWVGHVLPAGAETGDHATVTIPIETYHEYLDMKKRPALTIIEEVAVSGRLADGKLRLQIRGRSSGTPTAIDFIQLAESTRLRRCEGNALISRAESGYTLLPQSDRLAGSCELLLGQQESVSLQFGRSIMDVRATITDASVTEQVSQQGGLRLLLTRKAPMQARRSQDGKIAVTPRYRLTVTTDQIRFHYTLAFENPNPETKRFPVKLLNHEVVSRIETNLANELNDKEAVFELRPGSSQVTLTGQLPQNRFVPLFDNEEQYLLLEFHPLVALKLSKEPPRISVEQTGMSPSYQASMGFLIGKGKEVVWESKVREVFASDSYTGQASSYLIHLPEQGEAVIDAHWTLQNQGKPSLQFRLPGKAFFASTDGTPQVLAKTEKNELFLPLRTGTTDLRIQYEPSARVPRFFGILREKLVKPETALPEANVEIRLGDRHQILAANLLGEVQVPWFSAPLMLWAIVVALLWYAALRNLGVRELWPRSVSSAGLFFLGLAFGPILVWVLVLVAVAYAVRYRRAIWECILQQFTRPWRAVVFAVMAFGSIAVGGILLVGLSTTYVKKNDRAFRSEPSRIMAEGMDYRPSARFATKGKSVSGGAGPVATADLDQEAVVMEEKIAKEETYLGLPVPRIIPFEEQSLWLRETSIPKDGVLPFRLLIVSRSFVLLWWLLVTAGILLPMVMFRTRLRESIVHTGRA